MRPYQVRARSLGNDLIEDVMAHPKTAAVLLTSPEAVPDALNPSPVPMPGLVTEKVPTPMEAWMAASRLAPLLGFAAARDEDQSLRL
jgi:hypothetical protein